MNKQECKLFAKKIAKAEKIIQDSNDEKMIKQAQDEILLLSEKITKLEDLIIIDEYIQDILNKNKIF